MRPRLVHFVVLGFFALGITITGRAASKNVCTVSAADFHGWKAERIANRWVTLMVVPQLGGRLMQVSLGNHPYLFVNPKYYGQYFSPTEALAQHKWFNYGGDKDWPLPEGDNDEHHWASASSDVLDDSQNTLKVLSQGARCSVRLEGAADPVTGLQYSRIISIGADSPEIAFHAMMKNTTGHTTTWSIQSVSQYTTADAQDPAQYNHKFWAFTPVNPQSSYLESYHVRSGIADSRAFDVWQNRLFRLHWVYLESEVWIDSPADWIAVVDGASQYAMVERFHYDKDADYPGKASVIFYTNGPQTRLDSDGMPVLRQTSVLDMSYYMEAELNSPMVRLSPGETYAFNTEWFPTRVGADFSTATEAGLISEPLAVSKTPTGLHLAGSFGVLYPGRLVTYLYGRNGMRTGAVPLSKVDPSELVTLDQSIEAPATVERVSVHLLDLNGLDRGALGEAMVNPEIAIQVK